MDPTNGNAGPVGFTGIPPFSPPPNVVPLYGMSFAPNGTLYAIPEQSVSTPSDLWTINTTPVVTSVGNTAAATDIGSLGIGTLQATGLAFSLGGTLYTTDIPTNAGGTGQLLSVNTSTGATTPVGSLGVSQGQLAVAPDGTMYLAYTLSTAIDGTEISGLATVNPITGQATPIGAGIGFDDVFGLAFVDGTLMGAATVSGGDTGQLIDINTTTGAGTFVAILNDLAVPSNPDNIPVDSMADAQAVPEPSTLLLLLSGLGLGGVLPRLRRKRG